MHNPISGHNSPGYRFRLRVRAISHRNIYLPLSMKCLPEIRSLLDGVSPLEVFKVSSIEEAGIAFNQIRERYDFPFWAATFYRIPDIHSPSCIVNLRLNDSQFHIIDVLLKRSFDGLSSKYIITKSSGPCGLTTCVQAYIFWLRNINSGNSITWSVGDELSSLKSTLHLNIHIPAYSSDTEVYVPDAQSYAFLFPYNKYDISRNSCRLVDYVHLSDMSKWDDKRCEYSIPLYVHSLDIIHESPHSLCVMEGDLPDPSGFSLTWWRNYFRNNGFQMALLDRFKVNPLLVNKIISQYSSLFHIDLDQYLS